MTKAEIDEALDRVRTWPLERQQEAVSMLLWMEANATEVYRLSDEERAAIEESMAQARRGEFATDEEVAVLFNRYRAPGKTTRDL